MTNCAKNGLASCTFEREDEPDRPATDVRAEVVDIGVVLSSTDSKRFACASVA